RTPLGLWRVPIGEGKDHDLNRGQPDRERPGVVLDQYAKESLQGAEERPMNHQGPVRSSVLSDVAQIEPLGHVEIDLDCGALPSTPQAIDKGDNVLGPVKSRLA